MELLDEQLRIEVPVLLYPKDVTNPDVLRLWTMQFFARGSEKPSVARHQASQGGASNSYS